MWVKFTNKFRIERNDDTRLVSVFDLQTGLLVPSTEIEPNPRPYNDEENKYADLFASMMSREQVKIQLSADVDADEAKLEATIASLATLLGTNTTAGSIREWRSILTSTYSLDAQRAIADLLIEQAKQTRRIARQTLRLARLVTDKLESSNVGEDL